MNIRSHGVLLTAMTIVASVAYSSQPKEMDLAKAAKVVAYGEQLFRGLKGKPSKRAVEKVENLHVEGQIDEWHSLEYPNIKLKYYRVVPKKRNILRTLELTSSKYVLPFGIKIGVTRESIASILGKPSTSGPDAMEYECGDPYSQTVSFEFRNGRLIAIQWDNDID